MRVLVAAACLGALWRCASARPSDERQRFAEALERADVIAEPLVLTHLSHTCDLTIDGATYSVLDVRQIVPGMQAPRGLNYIVVLDAELRKVFAVRYTDERPLDCYGPRLSVFGELEVESDEQISEGNLLVFSDGGRSVHAETINWSAVPPWPWEGAAKE